MNTIFILSLRTPSLKTITKETMLNKIAKVVIMDIDKPTGKKVKNFSILTSCTLLALNIYIQIAQ